MAEQDKVILLGIWGSPFVSRVILALKLKGIAYEYVIEDLTNKSDLLLKSNPVYKKVPLLIHNGKPIAESLVILEYIDETWKRGPKLLPHNPYKRAQARFWAKFIHEQIFETISLVVKTEGEAQQKAINDVFDQLNLLENGMKTFFEEGKPCVDQNNVGLLDIVFCSLFGPHEAQEEVIGIKFMVAEKFPVLFSWLMTIVELQAVKEILPPHDKAVDVIQFIRQSALKSLPIPHDVLVKHTTI
ncbi:Thioredoxin-like superfamily [Sesbania bispinosa]|nr:Thioredoxin-like superfamily [Sesbania bispinosa]